MEMCWKERCWSGEMGGRCVEDNEEFSCNNLKEDDG